jgi:ATP-binding cassette subfamily B protein
MDTPASRRAGWRLMGEALRPLRRPVALAVLLGMAFTATKVAVPLFIRSAVDEGIVAGDSDALVRWTVLVGVVGTAGALAMGARRYFAVQVASRMETDLRLRLFAHLQRLHFAFHDQSQTGQLMARANTDLQQVNQFVALVPMGLQNVMTVASVAVVLLVVNAPLALLALAALPLVNLTARRLSKRMFPMQMELQEELGQLSGVVEETVSGIRVVKGLGAEVRQAGRLREEADDVYRVAMKAARVRSAYWPLLEVLPTVGLIAVLWYGGHEVLRGDLTLGELVAFNSYLLMLVWPLRMTGFLVTLGQRAAASAERVHEVLSTAPAVADRPDAVPLAPGGGEVRFERVCFAYEGGQAEVLPVLRDLDLVVRPGEAVALVGATGSGKSTVARLVPRFYDVQSGQVLLDGVDVRDVRVRDLRRAVGIVFEDTFLFSDTVRANIAFADPQASQEDIERAARLAGAHEFVTALPRGYDTVIGEHGFSLSGGQRQRIAIARAILADPRVLILDDATSSVDPTKEHEIREAMAEVTKGRTTIVIAHRPATIAMADRVVLVDEGRIAAEGTHAELLATSARYREVLARAEEAGVAAEAAVEEAGV